MQRLALFRRHFEWLNGRLRYDHERSRWEGMFVDTAEVILLRQLASLV